MHVASSSEFTNALAAQGVGLTISLPSAVTEHTRFGQHRIWPPSVVDAVDLAGIKLRSNPGAVLIEPPCRVDVRRLPGDKLSQALGVMINATLVPQELRDDVHVPNFASQSSKTDSCAEAEYGFLKAFQALGLKGITKFGGNEPLGGEPSSKDSVRIVVDERNIPLFLQKGDGNPTALTLRPIAIENVPYPVGSIVVLDVRDDKEDEWRTSGLRVLQSNELTGVGFQRVSTFAMPRRQRIDADLSSASSQDLAALRTLSMDQIVRRTARAVKLIKARNWLFNRLLDTD